MHPYIQSFPVLTRSLHTSMCDGMRSILNDIASMLSFFISFLSSPFVGHYTSLIKPFLVCPLVKREVFQFDPSNHWKMSKTCAQDASPSWVSPKASQLGTEGVFDSNTPSVPSWHCSRTGIFKCVMYAMQNGFKRISCSAAEVCRLPSLHSDEFCPFVELTFITQYYRSK